jgi:O-methyltransferase involved in polyketide biosynthesis
MARTDDDSWEITESVGATALGVAGARATETESDNPLISDPFARVFLNAAGDGMWNMFGLSELPPEVVEAEPDVALRMQARVDYMASRTAFFDGFFLDAANTGVRQVVILAAGLDSRAWRLPWPDGTTVYELDQPKVLEFKTSTLQERGAQRRVAGSGLPSIYAMTGRRRCGRPVLMTLPRAHGRPRDCCHFCRRWPRICCSSAFRR